METVLWSFVGGLLSPILLLIRHAQLPRENRPALVDDWWFWIGWLLLGFLGGVL